MHVHKYGIDINCWCCNAAVTILSICLAREEVAPTSIWMDVGITGSVVWLVFGMKANTQGIALDIGMGGVRTRERKAICDARCEAKLDFAFSQAGKVVLRSLITLTGI